MEIINRKKQLKAILAFINECELEIIQALKEDLGRPVFETSAIELGSLRYEISHTLSKLSFWVNPRFVKTPLVCQPGKSWIEYKPLGTILNIAPWNYPFQLTLGPLSNMIAAGNYVVIKPSELAPSSSRLLAHKLPGYLDVKIVEGGPEVTGSLLDKKWDHIFYTGGSRVAQIVLEKAAKYLTPVTLELGGKCPALVDRDADIQIAARRIAWGKFINAGQTCVAPDYVLVHEDIKDRLIAEISKVITHFFGNNPKRSPDYGRIINQAHMERLIKLCPNAHYDLEQRYFAPTLIEKLPEEEIFGPILPVISVKNLEEAVSFVNARPKPLALYYFSTDKINQKKVLASTHSGGVCINDTVSHLGNPNLPFGGVGESGYGAYHGRAGFERFSHMRSVYQRSDSLDIPLRYPPYSKTTLKIANWFQS
ncbi:MAG: aldehyde dehydrogenase family protein [Myxococcaceae bacterium]